MAPDAVIQSEDMPSIYQVPVNLQNQGLDEIILKKLGLPVGERPGLGPWRNFLDRREKATEEVHIALVGKYDLQDAYKSILESLAHAGVYNDHKVRTHFINSEQVTADNVATLLSGVQGVVICPGFGQRGIEGKITAARYTREHDIPTFGICLGMQMMVIEFARNVLGYADANSRERDETTRHNVIESMERHRHRYEFNNHYTAQYEQNGMQCVGINPESNLVEIVEIPQLKWYIGTQFHPEYSSTVLRPPPLFMSFVEAAIAGKQPC